MKDTIRVERARYKMTQADLVTAKKQLRHLDDSCHRKRKVLALKIAHFFEVKVEEIFTLEESD